MDLGLIYRALVDKKVDIVAGNSTDGLIDALHLVGLSDDPTQSANGLSAQVFRGATYGGVPAFDSSTDWPVSSSWVKDGQTVASGSKVQFQNAYVNNGTFVIASSMPSLSFELMFGGVPLASLAISQATCISVRPALFWLA